MIKRDANMFAVAWCLAFAGYLLVNVLRFDLKATDHIPSSSADISASDTSTRTPRLLWLVEERSTMKTRRSPPMSTEEKYLRDFASSRAMEKDYLSGEEKKFRQANQLPSEQPFSPSQLSTFVQSLNTKLVDEDTGALAIRLAEQFKPVIHVFPEWTFGGQSVYGPLSASDQFQLMNPPVSPKDVISGNIANSPKLSMSAFARLLRFDGQGRLTVAYVRVWKPKQGQDCDGKTAFPNWPENEYSVQYWFLFPFNKAPFHKVKALHGVVPKVGEDAWNHEGDWECIDVAVDCINPQSPKLKGVILHNHGRQIFVHPTIWKSEAWCEKGAHEPWPLPGTRGPTGGVTDNPLILTNEVKDEAGGLVSEWDTGQSHDDDHVARYIRRLIATTQQTCAAGDNRINPGVSGDGWLDCAIVVNYAGKYGSSDDSPESPFFQPKMALRAFDGSSLSEFHGDRADDLFDKVLTLIVDSALALVAAATVGALVGGGIGLLCGAGLAGAAAGVAALLPVALFAVAVVVVVAIIAVAFPSLFDDDDGTPKDDGPGTDASDGQATKASAGTGSADGSGGESPELDSISGGQKARTDAKAAEKAAGDVANLPPVDNSKRPDKVLVNVWNDVMTKLAALRAANKSDDVEGARTAKALIARINANQGSLTADEFGAIEGAISAYNSASQPDEKKAASDLLDTLLRSQSNRDPP